jgi:hypothetical protein
MCAAAWQAGGVLSIGRNISMTEIQRQQQAPAKD